MPVLVQSIRYHATPRLIEPIEAFYRNSLPLVYIKITDGWFNRVFPGIPPELTPIRERFGLIELTIILQDMPNVPKLLQNTFSLIAENLSPRFFSQLVPETDELAQILGYRSPFLDYTTRYQQPGLPGSAGSPWQSMINNCVLSPFNKRVAPSEWLINQSTVIDVVDYLLTKRLPEADHGIFPVKTHYADADEFYVRMDNKSNLKPTSLSEITRHFQSDIPDILRWTKAISLYRQDECMESVLMLLPHLSKLNVQITYRDDSTSNDRSR